jgi:hypothetical protein
MRLTTPQARQPANEPCIATCRPIAVITSICFHRVAKPACFPENCISSLFLQRSVFSLGSKFQQSAVQFENGGNPTKKFGFRKARSKRTTVHDQGFKCYDSARSDQGGTASNACENFALFLPSFFKQD